MLCALLRHTDTVAVSVRRSRTRAQSEAKHSNSACASIFIKALSDGVRSLVQRPPCSFW